METEKIKLIREMKRPVIVMSKEDAESLEKYLEEIKDIKDMAIVKSELMEKGKILVYDYEEVQDIRKKKIWKSSTRKNA